MKLGVSGVLKWTAFLLLMSIIVVLAIQLVHEISLPPDDFVEYWAAGRLQLTGNNPYSPQQLYTLQKSVGWPGDVPLMMWNPPWTLSFVMPFSLLDYGAGRGLWFLFNLALVLLCVDWTWKFYGGPMRYRWPARIVSFAFLPTLVVLYLGQSGPLILLGVVGFLHFERRQRWWWAGIAAGLIAIKPHLLYLFWIALLLWALDRRRWPVLLGSGLFGLVATAIPVAFNPSVGGQYLHTLQNVTPLHWETPALGTLLRVIFGPDKLWLQFLPSVLGAVWFLFYWQRYRHPWRWGEQMPLLLLVSVSTRSFGWTFDLVVLLPAVIQTTLWLLDRRHRWLMVLAMASYLAISALAAAPLLPAGDFWRFWMAPALLTLYLALHKQLGPINAQPTVFPSFSRQSPMTRGSGS